VPGLAADDAGPVVLLKLGTVAGNQAGLALGAGADDVGLGRRHDADAGLAAKLAQVGHYGLPAGDGLAGAAAALEDPDLPVALRRYLVGARVSCAAAAS
jgi:hypothetical protein